MARKELIHAAVTGEAPKRTRNAKPKDDLETAEAQEKILNPDTVSISLIDGQEFTLPTEFSLKDIFRNKVMNSLTMFYLVVQAELDKLGYSDVKEVPNGLLMATLFKEQIQITIAEVLHVVTGKPTRIFDGALEGKSIMDFFGWVLVVLNKAHAPKGEDDNEETDPKN